MSERKGFGSGLKPILPTPDAVVAQPEDDVQRIALVEIHPNPYQPRRTFDQDALEELSSSIRTHGVLQPIVARTRPEGGFWLVAGERRCRAAKLAGLADIPAVIRVLTDRDALAIALVENLQREDLNVIEEAESIRRLIEEFSLSHQEAGEAVGRSRSAVSNLLRLLELAAPAVRDRLANGQIDMGHARALLPLSESDQTRAAEEVVTQRLNVRQTERLVQRIQSPPAPPSTQSSPPVIDVPTQWRQRISLSHTRQGTDVRLQGLSDDELMALLAWLAMRDT